MNFSELVEKLSNRVIVEEEHDDIDVSDIEDLDYKESIKLMVDEMDDEEAEAIYHIIIEMFDEMDDEVEETCKKDKDMKESIDHTTSRERQLGKMLRRTAKWKKQSKLRYKKNKACPGGTTWSKDTKTCTPLNRAFSRLQKRIASQKIRY